MEQSKKFQYVCMFESQKQAKRFADYLGKKKVAIEALEEEGDTIFASSVQIILWVFRKSCG